MVGAWETLSRLTANKPQMLTPGAFAFLAAAFCMIQLGVLLCAAFLPSGESAPPAEHEGRGEGELHGGNG